MTNINSITYPADEIKYKWDKFSDKVMPGFKPDYVSAIVAKFFTSNRKEVWKSLSHTPNKGLLLAGPKGVGKTINFKIYGYIVRNDPNKNRTIKVISALEIQENYKQEKDNGRGAEYFNSLVNIPELVIDDIGSEDQKYNDYGTIRNLIVDLLMLRYQNFQKGLCVTHGTTNIKADAFNNHYDSRVVDRMKEMFVFQVVEGDSKRVNPIKTPLTTDEPEQKKSAIESRIEYLKYYLETPDFTDKGAMWNFLTKNGLLNEAADQDYGLKAEAERIQDNHLLEINKGKNHYDIEAFMRDYDKETGISKIVRNLAIRRYLSENKINIEDFTNEQIML